MKTSVLTGEGCTASVFSGIQEEDCHKETQTRYYQVGYQCCFSSKARFSLFAIILCWKTSIPGDHSQGCQGKAIMNKCTFKPTEVEQWNLRLRNLFKSTYQRQIYHMTKCLETQSTWTIYISRVWKLQILQWWTRLLKYIAINYQLSVKFWSETSFNSWRKYSEAAQTQNNVDPYTNLPIRF